MSASREEITDYVLGTLADWLVGYTFPEEGRQLRIRVVGYDDESVTISAEAMDTFPVDKSRFRVEVLVTEVAQQ